VLGGWKGHSQAVLVGMVDDNHRLLAIVFCSWRSDKAPRDSSFGQRAWRGGSRRCPGPASDPRGARLRASRSCPPVRGEYATEIFILAIFAVSRSDHRAYAGLQSTSRRSFQSGSFHIAPRAGWRNTYVSRRRRSIGGLPRPLGALVRVRGVLPDAFTSPSPQVSFCRGLRGQVDNRAATIDVVP